MSGYVKTFKVEDKKQEVDVFRYRWWEPITEI